MPCEDAPCCGCCGFSAWDAEDRANLEASFDEDFYADLESYDYDYDEDDEDQQAQEPVSQGRPYDESDYVADRIEAKDTEHRGWT